MVTNEQDENKMEQLGDKNRERTSRMRKVCARLAYAQQNYAQCLVHAALLVVVVVCVGLLHVGDLFQQSHAAKQ